MTLRTTPAWLALAAALTAPPAMAADMPAGYAPRGGAGFSAGWGAPPPPPPPVAVEAEADIIVAAPPPRRLLGFGYAPVLPYYGVSTGPYGYPPRPQPGVGVGLF
ncbi:hypothetical protein FF100_15760 [Methylobacterium terricola]|uniref:PXPV repeat-containing protein n=1 Tax=Methylobacterium terricola TaxID=2583531 RepID=A0A5C4LHN4_9HYPH|nr:hypothetical protein [Methylobacterium terricola]TNC12291.1 hypothetical protein FF100_15760 [Methylobacterium terricola]